MALSEEDMYLMLKEDYKYHRSKEDPFYKKLVSLIQETLKHRKDNEKNNRKKTLVSL